MKATLTCLSFCACSFPVLDESIQVGRVYDMDPNDRVPVIFKCGGCGRKHEVFAVWVAPGGYMPEAVLSLVV